MRKFFYILFRNTLFDRYKWFWIQFYPHVLPDNGLLSLWNQSEWGSYQQWINKHSILTRADWLRWHHNVYLSSDSPTISIVTPVYNTDKHFLTECILSVRMQTSPFWEMILVDDGSTRRETQALLKSSLCHDPRIHIISTGAVPLGISAATNLGIEQASSQYIVFLDHDDRLALDAVQSIARVITEDREVDIVYSDRDMISSEGKRFMHLMKPDWSPETLLSGNYIFHLMCYKKSLIKKVGGLRSEFDGSQDYDLILRCIEFTPQVRHIRRVLYHWRQHNQSISLAEESKIYTFDAGKKALHEAMQRRGFKTAWVSEIAALWRGHYRVQLPLADKKQIGSIVLDGDMPANEYQKRVMSNKILAESRPYIFIISQKYHAKNNQIVELLASWLALDNVAMVCGKLLDKDNRIVFAGMHFTTDGQLVSDYKGFDASEAGYMAVTCIVRNISLPEPFCVVIRRSLWQQLGGLNNKYQGPYSLLDFAFRAQEAGWRVLFDPQAIFTLSDDYQTDYRVNSDIEYFKEQWQEKLRAGDPYYNPNFLQTSSSFELNPDSYEIN